MGKIGRNHKEWEEVKADGRILPVHFCLSTYLTDVAIRFGEKP